MTEKKVSELIPVSKSDFRFLYDLLKERTSSTNISHKKMPTYKEHVKFVNSKPYAKWYVIHFQNKKVGTIYLTKRDEIGIFLKKSFHGKNIGFLSMETLIKKHPRERYLANVNPKNKKSVNFFKKNSFKLVQYTYELESS